MGEVSVGDAAVDRTDDGGMLVSARYRLISYKVANRSAGGRMLIAGKMDVLEHNDSSVTLHFMPQTIHLHISGL